MENKNKIKLFNIRIGILVFLVVVLIGLPFSLLSAYFLAFQERVYPKIRICQTSLTGKNKEESELLISSLLTENSPTKITLSYGNETFLLDPNILKYSPETTINKALGLGREKFFILNLGRLIKLLKTGEDLALDFQLNSEKLDSEIASVSSKLYVPAIGPQIKVIKGFGQKAVSVETGKNGREVDLRNLKISLVKIFTCPQKQIRLTIPTNIIEPKISEEMAQQTKKRAVSVLNNEVKLSLPDQSWVINDEEIISFISFDGGYNRSKIENFVRELAKTVNLPPENATFHFEAENNRAVVFKPSKEGITLKEAQLADTIGEKLDQLETTGENQEIELPVIKIPPKITTGDVNSLGIKELVSQGSSFFRGSISERIHNIQLASLKLNGILIAPDETFSFNQSLGDVSQDTGFEQAYIIKEGRTVLGDGGGVCQVSTTLFRAVLNAGLPIIERHAHAYRVHYYEDDLGPGFDATVFSPTADLKFTNDTSSYLLIQTNVDLRKKQLIFELYGTKDDRQIVISKARVWDKEPPPPDLYQDDPTLPVGTIKQVDWKAWGSKAAFDYKVFRNSETLFEKAFTSIYKPWQAVYLRGTR